jgi:hypothetical protein
VVSTGVRLFALLAGLSVCAAACAHAPPSMPSTATSSTAPLNPARIERIRAELPSGYEVAAVSGAAAPVALWGFGPDWLADPARCGVLGNPAAGAKSTRGWSASGAGGIVYAVVADAKAALDPALIDDCGRWTVSAGHTSGTVGFIPAPAIDGAATVGLTTSTGTVVEGGTQTHSHADTFTAYLDGYVVFITVVSDPGSSNPPLGQQFAANLLAKTVSALRG